MISESLWPVLLAASLSVEIPVFVGVPVLVYGFVPVLGLVVVALVALLEALPSALLLLCLTLRPLLLLLSFGFPQIRALLRLLGNIFGLFRPFLSIGGGSGVDAFVPGLIGVDIPDVFAVDAVVVAVEALDVLEVVGVADEVALLLALALAVGALLLVEERALVVVGDVVVVVLVLALVALAAVVGVELGVVVFAPHALGHQDFELFQFWLFLSRFLFDFLFFLGHLWEIVVLIEAILLLCDGRLGFLFDFFLPGLILIDILNLEFVLEDDDEVLQVLEIEVSLLFLDLLRVHVLGHLEDVELLLDDFVHDHIPDLVLLADGLALAEVDEQLFEGVEVGLEGGALAIAQHDDVVAAVEELGEVGDGFLHDEVDHVEDLDLLSLVVPDLVGGLELEEDVLVDVVDLGVEVAVVLAVLGEVGDHGLDDGVEADQLHQHADLLHQFLLALAQLPPVQPLVAVVDAVLLAFGHVLESADVVVHALEEDGEYGGGEGLVEGGLGLAVHLDDVDDDFGVALPVDLGQLEQLGEVQYVLSGYLFVNLVEVGELLVFLGEADDPVVDDEHDLRQSLGVLVDGLVLEAPEVEEAVVLGVEVLRLELGVAVGVHPAAVEVGEAGGEAVLEGGVVEHRRPEGLEVRVQQVVEVRDDLLHCDFAGFVVDEGLVEGLCVEVGDELGAVHVRLVHQLLLRYHVLFLHRLLLLLPLVPLPLLPHQLIKDQLQSTPNPSQINQTPQNTQLSPSLPPEQSPQIRRYMNGR